MFGSAESKHPRPTNGELFRKNSNLCDHNPPTSQNGRTDRQSDRQMTCDRKTTNIRYWQYLCNGWSDPLHVWFRVGLRRDGGSNGAIYDSNKSKMAAAAILEKFQMAISPQRLTIYLYSAHRAVIFAIAQLSCYRIRHMMIDDSTTKNTHLLDRQFFPKTEHLDLNFWSSKCDSH